ncbi:hypothetical protein GJ496_004609 [Pomphorhynchus laevis]|nr:hypothetical protein GJ496_004609 [Pomphorhynchus laevis]
MITCDYSQSTNIQNVDGLEQLSGIPKDKIVEAHGTFATSHCTACNKDYSFDWLYDRIQRKVIPTCDVCGKTVKPDVVLYGESLPRRFDICVNEDMPKADCVIILGTSLDVAPFCFTHLSAPASSPRIIINKTSLLKKMFKFGLTWSNKNKYLEFTEMCDQCCLDIAEKLNWKKELDNLVKSERERLGEFETLDKMVDHEQRQIKN